MNLSGVGEKTERKLKKIGILKAEDFLQYYPNHYEYFPYLTYIKDLAHLEEGTVVSIWVQLKVNVMRSGKVTRIWGGRFQRRHQYLLVSSALYRSSVKKRE